MESQASSKVSPNDGGGRSIFTCISMNGANKAGSTDAGASATKRAVCAMFQNSNSKLLGGSTTECVLHSSVDGDMENVCLVTRSLEPGMGFRPQRDMVVMD
jgi:hypothetical protein